MKTWTARDFFDHKSGSQSWPSGNRNDFPSDDTFICKKCGYQLIAQMYGLRPNGAKSFGQEAEELMLAHLVMFHRDEIPPVPEI